MERHRCTKCRNPIRNVAVSRAGADGGWYHADCWDSLWANEQESYEQAVRVGGLAALLAPYVSPAPIGHAASVAYPVQVGHRRTA
jgi:hypothetical protein